MVGSPLVDKPRRSVAGGQRFGVGYVSDSAGLVALLAVLSATAYPVLLEERVTGPGTGIFLLTWDGALRAVFAHRRRRTLLMEVNGRFWGSLQLVVDVGWTFRVCCGRARPHDAPTLQDRRPVPETLTACSRSSPARLERCTCWMRQGGGMLRAFLKESGRHEMLRGTDLRPATWETINWLLQR